MQNIKTALIWITEILKKHKIPFQITGGLAARAYGASRPIDDIDIDIPENYFNIVQKEVSHYLTFGPDQYRSELWDLKLMTLDYHGQIIDLSGAYETKVFNAESGRWQIITEDLSRACMKKIFDLELPIIPKEILKSYKLALAREVDLQDIREMNLAN